MDAANGFSLYREACRDAGLDAADGFSLYPKVCREASLHAAKGFSWHQEAWRERGLDAANSRPIALAIRVLVDFEREYRRAGIS